MSIFKPSRTYVTKQDFLIGLKRNKIEKKLFFYNLIIITALRNQNMNIICSYNLDLTRNAGNCLFLMLENKSSIFSQIKCGNLDSGNS